MNENAVARTIVDVALGLHKKIGPGVFETVYEVILAHEPRKRGLKVERQVAIPVVYDNLRFEEGFRADSIVEDVVIVEIKSIEALLPVRGKQLLTQLRLSDRKLGFQINFGEDVLKNGIKRVVNGHPDEKPRS